jgi:hydrogenase maturation protease
VRRQSPPQVLVLGLGNVLCGDDGLGVAALARLQRDFVAPEHVRLLDGGTLGLSLLPLLEEADEVVVLDAVRAEAAPGTPVRLEGDEVAPAVRERLSPHQVGVSDLLDALRWRSTWPRRLVLLGVVPETLAPGFGLSPAVRDALPGLVDAARELLADAGHPLAPRSGEDATPAAGPAGIARALLV